MFKKNLTIFILLFIITGCGNNKDLNSIEGFNNYTFITGIITKKFSNNLIVKIEHKALDKVVDYNLSLANKIIQSSMFIIGQETYLSKNKAKIIDIRGSNITFETLSSKKIGDKVKIYIPKKTIAITDFEIIGFKNNNLSKEIINNLTTRLVQSGQYRLIEREKLNEVLIEHKILAHTKSQKNLEKLGKLVSADIILTGTFYKNKENLNANLRLIDVSTGIILNAIKDSIPTKDLLFSVFKIDNFSKNFENSNLSIEWDSIAENMDYAAKISKVKIGANNTNNSIKVSGTIDDIYSTFSLINLRQRDLTKYKGIEFYAKASDSFTTLTVEIRDTNYENNKVSSWSSLKNLSPSWTKYRIDFNELHYSKYFNINNPGGDGILDLDNIQSILFGISGWVNVTEEERIFYIDEISLY